MPQYAIIDQASFDKAQEIIEKNTFKRTGLTAKMFREQRATVHGSQVLTGLLYCGECGRKFTGYYRNAVHKIKSGDDKLYRTACYRCNSFRFPKERKETCHAKLYNQEMLDYLVIKDAKEFLLEADKDKVMAAHKTKIQELLSEATAHFQKAEAEAAKREVEVSRLKDEIMKALLGKSSVSLEVLNELLKTKENERAAASAELLEAQERVLELDAELEMRVEVMEGLTNWTQKFESQNHAVRKTMLMNIIERIVATDESIEIHYKIPLTVKTAETDETPENTPLILKGNENYPKTADFHTQNCVQGVVLSSACNWRGN
ncbi:MAG: zinc ribbon domain-containing protein [Clostridiales bacterium]|jgi:DNA-directed RNA polymerase subunit RPC12/RpoP|nr:zinc ribbon domain-containing protein [Clostridiales bacterium]